MPSNTNDSRPQRRKKAISSALLSGAVLILAAAVTLWAQRTFWPEGVLARLLPYNALLYLLLLLPLAVSLKNRLKEINKGEEDEASQY